MKKIISALGLIVILTNCTRERIEDNQSTPGAIPSELRELVVSESFDFATSVQLQSNITVRDLQGAPISGVRIDFLDKDPLEGGQVFASGFTNSGGAMKTPIQVPTYFDEVFVLCHYSGFANTAVLTVNGGMVHDFGGVPSRGKSKKSGATSGGITPIGGNLYYMGSFNSAGLPDYLENPGDVLDAAFLNDINVSLPERSVLTNQAQYLATGNELDVVIDQASEVWVTFVSEGAGYRNSLAYYVYDTSNPPTSAAAIDSVFVIFPNTSFSGSGGDMIAGDKVKLGLFPAGKTISWVLLQNAWKGYSQGVNVNAQRIYSRSEFNPEPNNSDKQHSVQLLDPNRQLAVNSFEDILRNNAACDNDFNDCIFYVSANPWTAISHKNQPIFGGGGDWDGDGVFDAVDDYPTDDQRACDVFYHGALGFEDLWPSQGDYDFNDLVVDCDVTHVLNANNELVDVKADWTVRAVGAGYKNGFGWEFDNIGPSVVASVSGSNTNGNIAENANGTEANQSKATVIVFDNVFNEIQHVGGPFINTVREDPQANPVTRSMVVNFQTPQLVSDVGLPPYNPFIFVDGDRGREVHLSDYGPTDMANTALLGTMDDDSKTSQDKYYKTANNLPWAIHIYGDYDYPVEYAPINQAHLKFSEWAVSMGGNYADWYLENVSYRNQSLIY